MSILTDLRDTVRAIGAMMQVVNTRSADQARSAIINNCSVTMSNKTGFPCWTTITYKRRDATTALLSVLSVYNATTATFGVRTETFYNDAGTSPVRVVAYALVYNTNRDLVSETITNITNY